MGTWLVAFVVGFVYGVAGTIGQAAAWLGLPAGLVVAIVGIAALLVAVRLLTEDRWAALATGLGAMISTLVFSGKGPGGSVVVPAPADGQISTGVIWTIAVPILTAIVVGWPVLRAARTQRQAGDAATDPPPAPPTV